MPLHPLGGNKEIVMNEVLVSEIEIEESNVPDWAVRLINTCPAVKLTGQGWWRDISHCSWQLKDFLVLKHNLWLL